MKTLSLHGPWAYYERKAAENECRITDLETEIGRLKLQNEDLQQKLSITVAESKQLKEHKLPKLQSESEKGQNLIESLQAELARERLARAEEHRQLTAEVSSLTQELQKLSADNAVLRAELAKTVHQKQLTSTKLDQIRKKLGLTESEAKAFIQELDEARGASKALREENKGLASDNAHLKQQVESRSQHCMTLIGENKRLLEQIGELRGQLQKRQGELWQAKTEQQAAAVAATKQLQQQALGKKVVVREWVQPGAEIRGSGGGGAAEDPALASSESVASGQGATASASGMGRAAGKQNRAPWSDAGGGKTNSSAAATTSSAGGCVTRLAVVHIPVGLKPLGATDATRAGVVRQALAARQQRTAVSAPQQQQLQE